MIAIAKPYLTTEEAQYAYDTILTGWVTQGPKVQEFEEKFAAYVGSKYAVALSNCTTALHLAMIVGGIKEGDEVICPSMIYVATANCSKYVNATPMFAEVDELYNVDVADVEKRSWSRAIAGSNLSSRASTERASMGIVSMSRVRSHWPTKSCTNAAERGSFSIRATCACRFSRSLPAPASCISSSSGMDDHSRYESREAREYSSMSGYAPMPADFSGDFSACSSTNRKRGDARMATMPCATPASNVLPDSR